MENIINSEREGIEQILCSIEYGLIRIVTIRDGEPIDFYIEFEDAPNIVGNIYLGKVVRLLPGMNAIFLDIGERKPALLSLEEKSILDEENLSKDRSKIEKIKQGDYIPVQVVRSGYGKKGSLLTMDITIPGRFMVYTPYNDIIGVSKKIKEKKEEKRLRNIAYEMKPQRGGIIIRTSAKGKHENLLLRELNCLMRLWNEILSKASHNEVKLLYREPPLYLKVTRDLLRDNTDYIIDNYKAYHEIKQYVEEIDPELLSNLKYYQGREPLFKFYNVEERLKRLMQHQIQLPSGGYIVVDETEALTVIDVNTGSFTGSKDFEYTAYKTNMEAIPIIAKELRLRNIGGLIIIDFIDIHDKIHRQQLIKELKKEIRKDPLKVKVLGFTEAGLLQLTRKRTTPPISKFLYTTCSYCGGRGVLKSPITLFYEILRVIKERYTYLKGKVFYIYLNPQVSHQLFHNNHKKIIQKVEIEEGVRLEILSDNCLSKEEYYIKEG